MGIGDKRYIKEADGTYAVEIQVDEHEGKPVYAPFVALDAAAGGVDLSTVETLLQQIENTSDGLEALIGTTNASLTTLAGHVDGLEALAGTTNANLVTLAGHVDGMEALATTLNGLVDGLEASVDGLEASVDGLETLLTSPTFKTANGVATASGDNVCLAAVTGKKLRGVAYALQVQEAGTRVKAQFQDAGTATNRTMGWMLYMSADDTSIHGVVRGPGERGAFYFETAAGVGLDLNLSGAIDTAWEVTYEEV